MAIISVIVPVYKVEPYLHQCVDSILNQTFKDFELILVDDGSPDNCPAICDEYAKKDNRVIVIHKENGGVSSARNAGLDYVFANSNSEYISFVDSDDWVDKKYLATLYESIIRSDADLVRVNYKTFSDGKISSNILSIKDETIVFESKEKQHDYIIKYIMTAKLVYASWLSLFKKDIIKRASISYYMEVNFGEDWLFLLEYVLESKSISLVNEGLYYYRQRVGSCMNESRDTLRIDEMNKISQYFYSRYSKNAEYDDGFMTLIHYCFIDNQLRLPYLNMHGVKTLKHCIQVVSDKQYFKHNNAKVINLLKRNKTFYDLSFVKRSLLIYSNNFSYLQFFFKMLLFLIYIKIGRFINEMGKKHGSH